MKMRCVGTSAVLAVLGVVIGAGGARAAAPSNLFLGGEDDGFALKGGEGKGSKGDAKDQGADDAGESSGGASSSKEGKAAKKHKLGKASKGAGRADCDQSVSLQLSEEDEEVITFAPDANSCKNEKAFVGTASAVFDDGSGVKKKKQKHITLVPLPDAHGGGGDEEAFAATISDDAIGAVYTIMPDDNGTMTVTERYQEDYPDELDPVEEDVPDFEDDASGPSGLKQVRAHADHVESPHLGADGLFAISETNKRGLRGGESERREEGNGRRVLQTFSTIDVMVLWTKLAECRLYYGQGSNANCNRSNASRNAMVALAQLAVAETNEGYEKSGVDAEIRLAHAQLAPNYDEGSKSFTTMLTDLRTSGGGMPNVGNLRDTHKADVVVLFSGNAQYCGIGYVGPSKGAMFSVTSQGCATGYYSFGHEIAHNFGCNHDRGTASKCNSDGYGFGWRDPEAGFRTVLAYNCVSGQCDSNGGGGCSRINRYSNPNGFYDGKALGNAQNDCARRINDMRTTVEGYYSPLPPPPPPPPATPPPTPKPTTLPPTPDPTPVPPCSGDVRVEVTTDNWGQETTWTLVNDCDGQTIASGGPYSNNYYFVENYTSGPAQYTFTILDEYGDGICCGYGQGSYAIYCDGIEVAAGGQFGYDESATFGSCDVVTPRPTKSPTPKPTASPTSPPTPSPTLSPSPYAIYLCEDASFDETSTVTTNHAGSSTGKFLDMGPGSGAFVEFDVDGGPSGGPCALSFQYANGAVGKRRCDVSVNGNSVGQLDFASTGTWATWQRDKTNDEMYLLASCDAGSNAIRVTTQDAGGPNLDYLEVATATAAPTTSPTTMPTASPITPAPTAPPTLPPTEAPTSDPTARPTDAPTSPPTDALKTPNPSEAPTRGPTPHPSDAPSRAPTGNPTDVPTAPPTSNPTTPNPSQAPTRGPTFSPSGLPTRNPTEAPTTRPTDGPTSNPTTPEPTDAPTKAPTTGPTAAQVPATPQTAVYDGDLGAPKCAVVGNLCTSGATHLDGKASNNEVLAPNTLDSCEDGSSGNYHNDESVDSITVKTLDGGALQTGKRVEIEATVWAWSTGAYDKADFFYSATVLDPQWKRIDTIQPGGGANTLKVDYTIPLGSSLQAVRVQMRYYGNEVACNGEKWDDVDDLAFAVEDDGAAGDAAPDKKPPEAPPNPDSDLCIGIPDEERCQLPDACRWKGKNKGCQPMGSTAGDKSGKAQKRKK